MRKITRSRKEADVARNRPRYAFRDPTRVSSGNSVSRMPLTCRTYAFLTRYGQRAVINELDRQSVRRWPMPAGITGRYRFVLGRA